ncbi:MAG: protein translocase subunit SecD [Candidatus Pacebacteria bacterium]|nr:protein translocase subunit SecD [Candidatus Paceibacterota bacterium]
MIHFARWKIFTIYAVLLVALILALPNLFSQKQLDSMPSWVPTRQVSLGLDLQGGSHLLFAIDLKNIQSERFSATADAIRSELTSQKLGFSDFAMTELEGSGNASAKLPGLSFKLAEGASVKDAISAIRTIDAGLDVVNDGNLITVKSTPAMVKSIRDQAVNQSIEIIRRRIDETGTREPSIEQQGEDRILVQLPGVKDPQRIKDLIGTTAKLTFRLVDTDISPQDAQGNKPIPGVDLLPLDKSETAEGVPYKMAVRKRIMVSGENLVDAQPGFGQDGTAVINFRFDAIGSRRFGDASTENVGKPFAIVLDNKVLSAPVIREAITGGRGQISGNFTAQSASDLALLLRAGALPAPLTVLEERTVGPGLGADSIRAGTMASLLGFLLVAGFIFMIYGRFGLMANIALVFNVLIVIAALTLLQASLTLPGIAGIVLTMGMAVDANVLIFERIREEERNGHTVMQAVDIGYNKALHAIVDSNLTTLLANLFLYVFGTGPIRGFAITLSIGILASMFTAVTMTHYFMVLYLRWFRPKKILYERKAIK